MSKGGLKKNKLTSEHLEDLIAGLRKFDCNINDKHLQDITSFGTQTIPHLEKIIEEALESQPRIKFDQPAKLTESFRIVHAINLLAHLEASTALKNVLEFFAQKQVYVDYWLGSIFDEDLWEVFFKLGKDEIQKLKYFLLNKKHNEFYRLAAAKALIQIALHYKERANDVRNIFHTLLILEDEDRDFIGLVISELMDWRDEKLRPLILKKLNEVDVYCGMITVEDVDILYAKKKQPFIRQPQDIFELYKNYREVLHFGEKGRKKSAKILRGINLEKTPDSDY